MKRIVIGLVALAGCLVQPEFQGADFNTYDAVLVQRLRPGAQELWGLGPVPPDYAPRLIPFTALDGGRTTLVDPYSLSYQGGAGQSLLTVASYFVRGSEVTAAPLSDKELVASLTTATTLFQLWCNLPVVIRAGGGEAMLDDFAWCGPSLFGTGPTPERAVLVTLAAEPLLLDVSVESGVVSAAPSVLTLPAELDATSLRFLANPSDGVLAAVTESNGAWTYWQTGAEPVAAGATLVGEPGGSEPVVRDDDGSLRVTTADAVYRWVPDSAEVTVVATSPAPSVNAPWEPMNLPGGAVARASEPNPLDASLTMPTAVEARFFDGSTYQTYELPTTPCVRAEACRAIGESRVVGLVGEPGALGIVYEVWSWHLSNTNENLYGLYYVPFTP